MCIVRCTPEYSHCRNQGSLIHVALWMYPVHPNNLAEISDIMMVLQSQFLLPEARISPLSLQSEFFVLLVHKLFVCSFL